MYKKEKEEITEGAPFNVIYQGKCPKCKESYVTSNTEIRFRGILGVSSGVYGGLLFIFSIIITLTQFLYFGWLLKEAYDGDLFIGLQYMFLLALFEFAKRRMFTLI